MRFSISRYFFAYIILWAGIGSTSASGTHVEALLAGSKHLKDAVFAITDLMLSAVFAVILAYQALRIIAHLIAKAAKWGAQ